MSITSTIEAFNYMLSVIQRKQTTTRWKTWEILKIEKYSEK